MGRLTEVLLKERRDWRLLYATWSIVAGLVFLSWGLLSVVTVERPREFSGPFIAVVLVGGVGNLVLAVVMLAVRRRLSNRARP